MPNRVVGLLVLIGFTSAAPAALAPDQIALVINSKVPASRELAEFYAQRRGIPSGRIIALDLPFPQEEMPFEAYDAAVVPVVRKFLNDNALRHKVTCLVTFWGVPLRIGRRSNTPQQQQELATIQQETQRAQAELEGVVAQAEALAKEVTGTFEPAAGAGKDPAQLAARAGDAMTAALRAIAQFPPGDRRNGLYRRLRHLVEQLSGQGAAAERFAQPEMAELAPEPIPPQEVAEAKRKSEQARKEFSANESQPPGPRTFAAMRAIVREHFGLFRLVMLLQAQSAAFESKETESAFDSELALLWWENHYPRYRWQPNALNYKVRNVPPNTPPTLMVTRLDGPTAESVDRIILSSLKAEKTGLQGQVVLDGRGLKGDDGYGRYDRTIRELATLLQANKSVKVTFDDRDALIQPGPDAPKDVALYCGWYSLRNYVPAFKFHDGAVGYHVASSELVSLRGDNERGWVRGLLNDGVAATLGPVAEPYLHAFPPADEFFPLLMTGKLTLAEVYWKTAAVTSWMVTCVGDPLYTPYKSNPQVTVDELPEKLRAAVEPRAK